MKISFKYIIPVFALLVYSCSKMDEYKKFVPEGETIYAPVPMNSSGIPRRRKNKIKMAYTQSHKCGQLCGGIWRQRQ